MAKPYEATAVASAVPKFQNLGLDGKAELQALLELIVIKGHVRRGAELVRRGTASKRLTLLLDGAACSCNWLDDGSRHIHAIYYRGDFCDLHRYVLPKTYAALATIALTNCAIGTIDFKDIDQAIEQYPKLGMVLWRTSMIEAGIFRQRLRSLSRRPALQRVAHFLCEQLARLEAAGVKSGTLPLTQIDLADAAGLSVVHINRTISELRRLGVLSNKGRAIEVIDKKRLARIAQFDSRYLNMPELLSHWNVSVET